MPVNIIRAERLYAIRSRVPPVIKGRWRSGAVVVRFDDEEGTVVDRVACKKLVAAVQFLSWFVSVSIKEKRTGTRYP